MIIHEYLSKLFGKPILESAVRPFITSVPSLATQIDGYQNNILKKMYYGTVHSSLINDGAAPGTYVIDFYLLNNSTIIHKIEHVRWSNVGEEYKKQFTTPDILFSKMTLTDVSNNSSVYFIGWEITIEN